VLMCLAVRSNCTQVRGVEGIPVPCATTSCRAAKRSFPASSVAVFSIVILLEPQNLLTQPVLRMHWSDWSDHRGVRLT